MIKLSATAQARFSDLKSPPTHASLVSRLIQNGPSSSHDVVGLTLNYWLGTLDAAGAFVPDSTLPTIVMQIPTPATIASIGMQTITLLLTALFGAGIAPNPTNALLTVNVPGKVAGDHKIVDVDLIAAYVEPALAGTPV